jgi:hypothetical protein
MNGLLRFGRTGKAHASRTFARVGIVGLLVVGLMHLSTANSQSVDRAIELPRVPPIVSSEIASAPADVQQAPPARLNSARIALEDAKVAVSLSQAQLAQARMNLREFQAKHDKAKILAAQGKVTRKQADLAVTAYKLAQLQHTSASIGLRESQAQLIAAKAEVSKLGCKSNSVTAM